LLVQLIAINKEISNYLFQGAHSHSLVEALLISGDFSRYLKQILGWLEKIITRYTFSLPSSK
jgi:hypothetical protein